MSKTLAKYFPIFDYLYIYQLLEYNFEDFFKWFLKNPFKRNLQKKHSLNFSNKIIALLALTLFWQSVAALIFYSLTGSWLFFIMAFLLLQFLTPGFIIMADLSIDPIENYLKKKLLKKAEEKLATLPNLKVVAITGSFGKTSTKDILYTLLFKKYFVVKTPKTFNTPLGIAQTVLEDIKDNTQVFICEVGAYKMGEIKKITSLIKPQIGIITAIAPQHLEKFGSLENIARAKFELIEGLKNQGLAILNGEYNILQTLASSLTNIRVNPSTSLRVNFYGRQTDPYYATNIHSGADGTNFILHTPKGKINIQIPLIGEHHVQNFLAACAACLNLGLSLAEIKQRAKLLLPTPHRMEIKNMGKITLIDNSFNTNPTSAKSSLKLLASFKNAQKIVVTPGFIELGKQAPQENMKFGKETASIADEIIIVGENAKIDLTAGIRQIWLDQKTIHYSPSTQEALELAQHLAQNTTKQAAILIENDLPDQYF